MLAPAQPFHSLPATEHPLHCTTTRITADLFYTDLSSPTCGTALLFDCSPRAACMYSATSGSVTFSRPASTYDPSSLPIEQPAYQALPLEHAPYSGQASHTIQTTEQATFVTQQIYTMKPPDSKQVHTTNSVDQDLHSVPSYVAQTSE